MNLGNDYKIWIASLKDRIRSAQLKAAVAVNVELILLYWDVGKNIVEKQEQNNWGSKIVDQIANDLKRDLPDTNGFSRTNLFAMRKFYLFYKDTQIVHQLGGQFEKNEIDQQHTGLLEKWMQSLSCCKKCNNCA